jgi:hypothetical protein
MKYRYKSPYREHEGALIGYHWNLLSMCKGIIKIVWSSTTEDFFTPTWKEPPKKVRNHLDYKILVFDRVVKSGKVESIWDWPSQGLEIHGRK